MGGGRVDSVVLNALAPTLSPATFRPSGEPARIVAPRASTRTKPRVLILAEGCNPDMTSVPLVGYSHCKAIKAHADALVLTHWRNGPALEAAGWVEGEDFDIIDTEWAARGVWKICTYLRGGTGKG